jgi:homoserine dehydrogenase
MSSKGQLRIGLLGCGTVGGGLVELVSRNRDLIRQRSGVDVTISKILVRDLYKERPGVTRDLLTTQAEKVIRNGCDLVVELVGGIEPARSLIRQALAQKKHVVTANKALLAAAGFDLRVTAAAHRVRFGFEASVCGGLPIVRALQTGLAGNRIQALSGILNGTSNFILTRMSEDGVDFDVALHEAQAKGFAEADPSLDVDGNDAGQKLQILAEIAFGGRLKPEAVEVEGIRDITSDDVQAARELGCVVKQVAEAEAHGEAVSLRVAPVLLPAAHPLAAVRDEFNAVVVKGDAVGEMTFCGKGAGSLPSASAVLSDVVEIARQDLGVAHVPAKELKTASPDRESRHYLRFPVPEPSAVGKIVPLLERHGIAVASASATWARNAGSHSQVKVITHECSAAIVKKAVGNVVDGGDLAGKPLALRVAS